MIDSISALGPTQPAAEPRAHSRPAPGDPSSFCPVQRPSAPSSRVQRPARLHDHFQHRCSSQSQFLSASKTGRGGRFEEGNIRGLSLWFIASSKEEILYFLLLRICLVVIYAHMLFRFVVCVCGRDALRRSCRGDRHRESVGQLQGAVIPLSTSPSTFNSPICLSISAFELKSMLWYVYDNSFLLLNSL